MLTMIHLYDERNRKKKKLVLSLMIILFSILKCVLCSRKKPELIRLKLSYCASLQHYSQGQISFSRLQCPDFFLFIDINPSFSLLYTYTHTHTHTHIYIYKHRRVMHADAEQQVVASSYFSCSTKEREKENVEH